MDNRRHFLKSLLAAPVLGAGCAHAPAAVKKTGASTPGPNAPQHIIHLVADGMSSGTLACADHFSQAHRGRRLTWFELLQRDEIQVGVMDVRSQNSLVTDSSASSSAWGSGVRIPNGKVNQASDGRPLVTLYELLGEAGWQRGLVTTTEITHATPAGFAACVKSRGDAEMIATQYLDRHVDVALGGGRNYFLKDKRKDKRDLRADYVAAGYAILERPEDLQHAPGDQRWLGIFAGGHLPFLVDQRGGLTKVEPTPALATMTHAALKRLSLGDRFMLQVEGGRVDHGGHNNDAAAAVLELIAFDEALDVCLEFQREHPQTLLVITTDHGTGNPGLNGMGDDYGQSSQLFRHVAQMRQSLPEIVKRLQLAENAEAQRAILKEATGYAPSARRLGELEPFLRKKGYALYDGLNSEVGALGQVMGNHLGISFTSTAHTSDHVPVLALGPGADRFHGFVENTEIFDHYVDLAGVRFRNPQEPLVVDARCLGAGPREVPHHV